MDEVFMRLVTWFAPAMPFTTEEAFEARGLGKGSVHLQQFPATPDGWLDAKHAERWERIFSVRKAVTGALEVERREKRIGSSLEANVDIVVADQDLLRAFEGEDGAELFITSGATLRNGATPDGQVAGVVSMRAAGVKCARSWKYFDPQTADPEFPDITPRDAEAVRELRGLSKRTA